MNWYKKISLLGLFLFMIVVSNPLLLPKQRTLGVTSATNLNGWQRTKSQKENTHTPIAIEEKAELTLNVTDNKTNAGPGDKVNYVIQVGNIGKGKANGVTLKHKIPDQLTQDNTSLNLFGSVSGKNQANWTFDIAAGENKTFQVSAVVNNNIPSKYTNVYANSTLTYEYKTKTARDKTQLYKAKPTPNYEIFLCITFDGDYIIGHLGYDNKLDIDQPVDLSGYDTGNAKVIGTVPKVLLPGRHADVVQLRIPKTAKNTWRCNADKHKKQIVFDQNSPLCPGAVKPGKSSSSSSKSSSSYSTMSSSSKTSSANTSTISSSTSTAAPIPAEETSETTPEVDDNTWTVPLDPEPKITINHDATSEFVGITKSISGKDKSKKGNLAPIVFLGNVQEIGTCSEGKSITGSFKALDNDGKIAGIQYSLNNGKSWLGSDDISGIGTKQVTGSLISSNLFDGNYDVLVRAIDDSGNIGLSQSIRININCKGVIIGSTQFNQGEQLSPLSTTGIVYSMINKTQYMAVVIEGGPITAELRITSTTTGASSTHPLIYNQVLELWETEFELANTDLYRLRVIATEKSGKQFSRAINSLQTFRPGNVLDGEQNLITSANVTLYYRANREQKWEKWNAPAFNQSNPQKTAEYSFLVEPGYYYLNASANGYFDTISQEFYISHYSLLTSDIVMHSQKNPLNWFKSNAVTISPNGVNNGFTPEQEELLGQQMPSFEISNGSRNITSEQITNNKKYSLLITWTDWGTLSSAQLAEFKKLYEYSLNQDDFDLYFIGLLEGVEEDFAQILRGKYQTDFYKVTKNKGNFFWDMAITSAPQYYFVDKDGLVENIQVGNFFATDIYNLINDIHKF